MSTLEELVNSRIGKMQRSLVKQAVIWLPTQFHPGEEVFNVGYGMLGRRAALVVVTDRRVIFGAKQPGPFFARDSGPQQFEDFPFEQIVSIRDESGLFQHLEITTAGGKDRIEKLQPPGIANEIAQFVRSRMGASSAPATNSPVDIPEQLRQLASLHDSGILTESEFETKKAELLARM